MIPSFQVFYDRNGDIQVTDGAVYQPRTGTLKLVGSGGALAANPPPPQAADYTAARQASGSTYVAGSGRNLLCTGLPPATSAAPEPSGWWRPTVAGAFVNVVTPIFTLTVTGPDAAEIHDGTAVLAILTTGGLAPLGDYESTPYGEDTNNGGDAFTLTLAAEEGAPGTIPAATVAISAGSAQGGAYETTDGVTYTSADDPDWTFVINADGTADLCYLTDIMASRTVESAYAPTGGYVANALGMASFNLTAEAPVDGEPWTATVVVAGRVPRIGYVYLEVIESAGVLDQVNGPFFATGAPAAAGDTYYPRLAYCDGTAVEQYHTGALLWDRTPAPSSGSGLAWVSLTQAAYDALDPPDADTIYDITDADWLS